MAATRSPSTFPKWIISLKEITRRWRRSNPQAPKDVDRRIAEHIMKEIEDGSCLQLGIGGLPNLIGQMIAESDLKDLGIHTEMLCRFLSSICITPAEVTGRKKSVGQVQDDVYLCHGNEKTL